MSADTITESFDCIIVGAGHGGSQAAACLRQFGYKGTIALIGAEPEMPYDRPSLSKDYLAGKKTFERMHLRPADFWVSRDIVITLGRRVNGIDPVTKTITLDDGTRYAYGSLIWATGGVPRRLTCKGHDLSGVFYVRDKSDVDLLMAALPQAKVATIVGGGFIGLEAAAVLREQGKDVVLIESLDRVLARVADVPISRFYEEEHRRHGVEIRLNSAVASIAGRDGAVTGIVLASGETIATDIVIVGIGIVPDIAPLLQAGAVGGNGVHVDAFCRTNLTDVYCIGDCARMMEGAAIRIESVQNASDQAMSVARTLCDQGKPYDAIPWFWSNQYDLKLQTIGLSVGYDDTVLRGDPATRSFSLIYLKNEAVIALDCVNAPRDYVQGKKLVEAAIKTERALLADTSVPLKDHVLASA